MTFSLRLPLRPAASALLALAACLPLPAAAAPRCPPHLKSLDLPDGGRYCGQMQRGKLHGQGRIDWKDDEHYEGQFAGGFMQGRGHIVTPEFEYTGQMQRGRMHGQGKLTRDDDWTYEGEFADNRMHGQGKLTLGLMTYEGQFLKDLFTGHGRFTDSNGGTMEGRFDNFEPQGKMTITWPTGDRYEGPQMGNMPHGEGVWTRADKAVVRGVFSFGSIDGKARIEYPDGAIYTGPVDRQMMPQGKGELRYPNGNVYAGRLSAERPDGPGTLTRADGSVQTGYWQAGEYSGTTAPAHAAGDDAQEDTPEVAERNNEAALYNQPALLQSQWDQLQSSSIFGAPRMYALYVAGDGSQEVFRREVAYVDDLFARRFGTRGRSVSLVNSRSSIERLPLATAHSIELALQQLAQKMNRERDVLFVFLTSHGSEDHQLSLGMRGLRLPDLPAQRLGELLKASGIRNQIVVVSACYSGGFVPALQGDRTWVITAASADRTSFGCADDNQFTYFGRALFKDALAESASLSEAFARADQLVREWEDRDASQTGGTLPRAPAAFGGTPEAVPTPNPVPGASPDPTSKPKTSAAKADGRSLPRSVVTPAFQAEMDAWFRRHPAPASPSTGNTINKAAENTADSSTAKAFGSGMRQE
ncbi:C13 family peptidase [Ottowia sp.]|uniref:C13 family peptidase n=1 Tax=Ottowia sp. TaxID=1898956 RepID=UPI003A880FEC